MKFFLVITHFSHTLQFSVHGTTHDVCLVSFLPFYISRILNMLHHMMPDEIPSRYYTFLASYTWYSTWRFITFIRKSCFFTFSTCYVTFMAFDAHCLLRCYSLTSIDLSFLSGQGLPLASDNVKYWCLVRCPFWFISSSLPLEV